MAEVKLSCSFVSSLSLRMSILSIIAREILDSRGNPTVEVDLRTDKGESKAKEYVECVIYNVN